MVPQFARRTAHLLLKRRSKWSRQLSACCQVCSCLNWCLSFFSPFLALVEMLPQRPLAPNELVSRSESLLQSGLMVERRRRSFAPRAEHLRPSAPRGRCFGRGLHTRHGESSAKAPRQQVSEPDCRPRGHPRPSAAIPSVARVTCWLDSKRGKADSAKPAVAVPPGHDQNCWDEWHWSGAAGNLRWTPRGRAQPRLALRDGSAVQLLPRRKLRVRPA